MKRYCAIYMPENDKDPSAYGFKTEDKAYAYAESKYCNICKKLEKQNKTSACSCEWEIYKMNLIDYLWWIKQIIKRILTNKQ